MLNTTARQPHVDDTDPSLFGPDNSKAFGGLTPQQYRYCELRSDGIARADAFSEAYAVEGERALLADRARKVEESVRVVGTINRMVSAKRRDTSLVPLVDRNFVLEGITSLALNGDKDSVRLRAFELLGKVHEVNLFAPETRTDKPRTIEDIDKELRERLAELANVTPTTAGTIEGTARPSASASDRRRKPKV